MIDLYVLNGGIGKQAAFSALLKRLKEMEKRVAILTPYPDLYYNHPFVEVVYDTTHTQVTPDFFRKFGRIFNQDAYQGNYIKGNYHLIDSYCDMVCIDKSQVAHKLDLPQRFQVQKPKGDYVIVQFTGGQAPVNFNPQNPYQINGMHIGRNFDLKLAQDIVDYLILKGLKVVLYGLPNEIQLKNVIRYDIPYMHYLELARDANFIVAIDSSLMHLTAATDTRGVILWGMTNPGQLGYEQFTNLITEVPERVVISMSKIKKAIDGYTSKIE